MWDEAKLQNDVGSVRERRDKDCNSPRSNIERQRLPLNHHPRAACSASECSHLPTRPSFEPQLAALNIS